MKKIILYFPKCYIKKHDSVTQI